MYYYWRKPVSSNTPPAFSARVPTPELAPPGSRIAGKDTFPAGHRDAFTESTTRMSATHPESAHRMGATEMQNR
jgi:hypothetical protein